MAKAEIKTEIKSLTGKGAEKGLIPWIPKRLKIAMGVGGV